MRYRGHGVPCCGVAGVHRPGRIAVVTDRRMQRRQAGHGHGGALRGLPQRTVLAGVLLSMAVVVAGGLLVRGLRRGGTRNAVAFGSGLKMSAGGRDAPFGCEVTHRRIRADGMRIQQTEEEQAQTQHVPQNR